LAEALGTMGKEQQNQLALLDLLLKSDVQPSRRHSPIPRRWGKKYWQWSYLGGMHSSMLFVTPAIVRVSLDKRPTAS